MMWKKYILLGFLVMPSSALADTQGQSAAWDYEKCIVDLRHLSGDDITKIREASPKLPDAAVMLANEAVRTCHGERAKLRSVLASEGKMDAEHEKAIDGLEEASKFYVKAHALAEALKQRKAQ